jgi:FkbM family methyltransferase
MRRGTRSPPTDTSTSVSCSVPRSRAGRSLRGVLSRPLVSRTVTSAVRPVARWIPIDQLARIPVVGQVDVPVPGCPRHVRMWTDGYDGVAAVLFWRGLSGWEPETVAVMLALARRAPVVLDIGANVGLHSLLLAAANPDATIHAFEPIARVCARLERNLELNGFANVHVHQLALSNGSGVRSMHVPPFPVPVEASADAAFRQGGEVEKVSFSTLDEFVAAHDLGSVDLVKVDTEGTEHLVVEGAMATLRRHRPFLVVEVLPGGLPEEAVAPPLRDLDYVSFHLTGNGPVRRDAVVGEAAFKNWLFAPADRIGEIPSRAALRDGGASSRTGARGRLRRGCR